MCFENLFGNYVKVRMITFMWIDSEFAHVLTSNRKKLASSSIHDAPLLVTVLYITYHNRIAFNSLEDIEWTGMNALV